jgi:uncharacterized protein YecT (DUF1311 family)
MSSEQAAETQDSVEPFVGFHFYADDAPRHLFEAPAIQSPGSRVIRPNRTADIIADQRSRLQKIALPNPGQARAIRKDLWIALVAIVFVGAGVVLGVSFRNAKQLALNAPTIPAPGASASQPLVMAAIGAPKPISPSINSLQTPPIDPSTPQSSFRETCRSPQTRAERLVCRDPELAAEDRRLAQVYRAAIAGGAPKARLAREQDDWLKAREVASRRSGQDVQNLYAARIDDLMHWLDDEHTAGLRQ